MNESVQLVLNYLEEVLFEPGVHWPEHMFAERSYARWAASEIVGILMDHPFEDPDILVEAFMIDMMDHMYQAEHPHPRFIFATAKETAEDILKLLIKRRRT